jgi:XPG N-terminal domain
MRLCQVRLRAGRRTIFLTPGPLSAQSFEEWAAPSIYTYDFEDPGVQERFKDIVLGIDASYYLDLRLNKTSHEPLLHALGGFPYSLKKILDDDIQLLRSYKIKPIFVFDGLDFRNKEQPSSRSLANRKAHEDGWKHYSEGDPEQTVADFSRAGKKHELSTSKVLNLLITQLALSKRSTSICRSCFLTSRSNGW